MMQSHSANVVLSTCKLSALLGKPLLSKSDKREDCEEEEGGKSGRCASTQHSSERVHPTRENSCRSHSRDPYPILLHSLGFTPSHTTQTMSEDVCNKESHAPSLSLFPCIACRTERLVLSRRTTIALVSCSCSLQDYVQPSGRLLRFGNSRRQI